MTRMLAKEAHHLSGSIRSPWIRKGSGRIPTGPRMVCAVDDPLFANHLIAGIMVNGTSVLVTASYPAQVRRDP